MENLKLTVTKTGSLTMMVDLTKTIGPSASGKTILIGTTGRAVEVDGFPDVRVNCTVYRYPPKA